MGARALMLRKRSGLRRPSVMAPWPPMEWPMMEQRDRSSCCGGKREGEISRGYRT